MEKPKIDFKKGKIEYNGKTYDIEGIDTDKGCVIGYVTLGDAEVIICWFKTDKSGITKDWHIILDAFEEEALLDAIADRDRKNIDFDEGEETKNAYT